MSMKATINAVPKFELDLPVAVVELLIQLAERHYDLTCQASARPGGLLFGWRNCVVEFSTTCSGSFRDLDLTLKIAERLPENWPEADKETVRGYCAFVCELFKASEMFDKHTVSMSAA